MTADGTGGRMPTDDQLADILRFIARTCLEVERGLRPPRHLLSLMDPAIAHIWAEPGKLGRFRGGPVQQGQIGHPQISRLTDNHVVATVVTRTEGDRWGALTLRLRTQHRRWRVVDLQRLLAVAHYGTGARATAEVAIAPDNMLAHAAEDRRLADAAHKVATRRLADLAPDAPGYRAAREVARFWERKLGELDREFTALSARQQMRDHLDRVLRR